MENSRIKSNPLIKLVKDYAWIITVLVAIGGLWEPKLGLIVIFIMVSLILMSFFKGRFWCGNFCPHGSLFDKILKPVSRNKKLLVFMKAKSTSVIFFIFFMFNFTRKILNISSLWGQFDFYDKLGFLFVNTYLMVLVVGGLMAVFVSPRQWCQICPMGTMQKGSHKLGEITGIAKVTNKKVSITTLEQCKLCGICSKACPVQLTPHLDWSATNQFDNNNCIKCSACIEKCPFGLLSMEKAV